MLACAHPTFDGPVILFQNIIEILYRSMLAILLQNTVGFEPHDGRWISSVLVGIDYPRRGMVLPAQRFGEEALSGRCVAFSRQKETIVALLESTARYKYTHLPLTRLYVSSTRQLSLVGRRPLNKMCYCMSATLRPTSPPVNTGP